MQVVFFTADHEGCGFYRCLMPAVWLNRLGLAEAYCSHSFTHKGEQVQNYKSFYSKELLRIAEASVATPKTTQDVLVTMSDVDVCVYQRQSNEFALVHMRTMKKAGKKVFVEYDDWLLGKITSPHAKKVFQDPRRREIIELMAYEADGLIVSTEALKSFFSEYNSNIYVCPNSLDLDIWRWKDSRALASVGYAGSHCHNDDFKSIELAMWRTNKKYRLKFMNFIPEFLAGYEYIKGVEIEQYPETLSGLFSIGIIPLYRNDFNQAKSSIKFFEYTMAGIMTIAENWGPYQCIEDGVTGLLVDGDWQEKIDWAMTHPVEVEIILQEAQKRMIDKYMIQDHAYKWASAFEDVLKPNIITKEEVHV